MENQTTDQTLARKLTEIRYNVAVEASNACFQVHSLMHALGMDKDGDYAELCEVTKLTDRLNDIIVGRVNRYLEEMGSDRRWKH